MTPIKCFLIDDDPAFCNGLIKFASRNEVEIDVFYSAQELERLGYFDYDAGIIDIDLGPVQGPELDGYLKAVFKNCPLIYISANNPTEHHFLQHFVSKAQGFKQILNATLLATLINRKRGNRVEAATQQHLTAIKKNTDFNSQVQRLTPIDNLQAEI